MAKKFDIFISYRRKGGFDSAKLLYDRLRLNGYSVSFDMDTLERGNFDSELENRIKKCKDFLVVLNPGVFDRFYEPESKDDWVRREIACAIAEEKNIVPVILDGFQWPKNPLPADVKDLARKNGIDLNPKYFEAMYAELKQKFLISKPDWTIRYRIKIILGLLIAFLVVGTYLYFETTKISRQKILEIQLEKRKINSILLYQDSIIRLRDSIANVRKEQLQLTDSIFVPDRKQLKKSKSRTLHWIGPKDAVGSAIYEKLISVEIQSSACYGDGININANNPTCQQLNSQIMCTYLLTLTLTDCKRKSLGALKITTEFIGLQKNETLAKQELAANLQSANFSNIISNIEKYRRANTSKSSHYTP